MPFENKTWGDAPDGKFGILIKFKNTSEAYYWYSTKSKRDSALSNLRKNSKRHNSTIVELTKAHR